MEQMAPNIAFLGVCERAFIDTKGGPLLEKYNILGLKNTVLSYIYPIGLQNFQFAFAIYDPENYKPAVIRILKPDGEELFHIEPKFEFFHSSTENLYQNEEINNATNSHVRDVEDSPSWFFYVYTLPDNYTLMTPGTYKVVISRDFIEIPIGCIKFEHIKAQPLTDERIAAIKSNPNAVKAIRIVFGCKKCSYNFGIYTALEKNKKQEDSGLTWYQDLPAYLKCTCGELNIDTSLLRENFHGLLGQVIMTNNNIISFSKLYEESALEAISVKFETLLNQKPNEEKIQQLIKDNTILLQQFSPEKIFFKSPILTKYITDITILNNKKELILIELEKPELSLIKKDGGIASPLQHAFDQVRDWLHMIDDHRLAVLECIGLKPDEVTQIRGLVIGGRDTNYKAEHLRKLKWTDFGRVTFFTYDDLAKAMISLIDSVKAL